MERARHHVDWRDIVRVALTCGVVAVAFTPVHSTAHATALDGQWRAVQGTRASDRAGQTARIKHHGARIQIERVLVDANEDPQRRIVQQYRLSLKGERLTGELFVRLGEGAPWAWVRGIEGRFVSASELEIDGVSWRKTQVSESAIAATKHPASGSEETDVSLFQGILQSEGNTTPVSNNVAADGVAETLRDIDQLIASGSHREARAKLKTMQASAVPRPSWTTRLAVCLAALGEKDEALGLAREAKHWDPDDPTLRKLVETATRP